MQKITAILIINVIGFSIIAIILARSTDNNRSRIERIEQYICKGMTKLACVEMMERR